MKNQAKPKRETNS